MPRKKDTSRNSEPIVLTCEESTVKSQKINFYFVLYLIAVVSGFVAITERDEEKVNTRKIRELLKKEYTTMPHIIVSEDQHFALKAKEETDTISISQSGLLSSEDTVHYTFAPAVSSGPKQWASLKFISDPLHPGAGLLPIPLAEGMKDSLKITLRVRRIVPRTYPNDVRMEIQKSIDSINGGWFETEKTIMVRADFAGKPKPRPTGTGTSSE